MGSIPITRSINKEKEMDKRTHEEKYKVAIVGILGEKEYCHECGGTDPLIASITDWEIMSWDEIRDLYEGLDKLYNTALKYRVVVQPLQDDQKDIVIKSLAEGRRLAAKRKAEIEAERKAAEEKKKERERKRLEKMQAALAKDRAARLAEYERLKAEFESSSDMK